MPTMRSQKAGCGSLDQPPQQPPFRLAQRQVPCGSLRRLKMPLTLSTKPWMASPPFYTPTCVHATAGLTHTSPRTYSTLSAARWHGQRFACHLCSSTLPPSVTAPLATRAPPRPRKERQRLPPAPRPPRFRRLRAARGSLHTFATRSSTSRSLRVPLVARVTSPPIG